MKFPVFVYVFFMYSIAFVVCAEPRINECQDLENAFVIGVPKFVAYLNSSSRFWIFVQEKEGLVLYDFPLESLEGGFLNFSFGFERVLAREKWPQLFANESFKVGTNERGFEYGLVSFADEGGVEYLLVEQTNWEKRESQSAVLNIATNETTFSALKMVLDVDDDEKLVTNDYLWPRLIPSNKPNQFYELIFVDSGNETYDHALIELALDTNRTELRQVAPLKNLCFGYRSRKVSFTTDHCDDWFLIWSHNGFFHQGKFYLFDHSAIHIIDQAVVERVDEEFSFVTMQYSDWIKC